MSEDPSIEDDVGGKKDEVFFFLGEFQVGRIDENEIQSVGSWPRAVADERDALYSGSLECEEETLSDSEAEDNTGDAVG